MTAALTWRAYLGTVDPVELPLATLTVNLKHAAPSYHAISVPWSAALVGVLAARPTDTIRLHRGGSEWGYFNRNTDMVYEGAMSKTITLSGYRQETFAAPVSVTLPRTALGEFRNLTDGSIVTEIHPDTVVRPQDTVIVGATSYTATKLDYALSPGRSRLKLTMMEV